MWKRLGYAGTLRNWLKIRFKKKFTHLFWLLKLNLTVKRFIDNFSCLLLLVCLLVFKFCSHCQLELFFVISCYEKLLSIFRV
jgi:hypothetical protein